MSGPEVHLTGESMGAFVEALNRLAPAGAVLIGGVAVMSRLGGVHRVTLDVDAAFHNPTDVPSTVHLVTTGIARPGVPAGQTVEVGTAKVDVIDTHPIEQVDLPDDPKNRLFVCAHRFAFETATPVAFHGDHATATIRVATADALIAMKSHALRFATSGRRQRKRDSDLHDLFRLHATTTGPLIGDASWALQTQVRDALTHDLANRSAVAATLRSSREPAAQQLADVVDVLIEQLLARLV